MNEQLAWLLTAAFVNRASLYSIGALSGGWWAMLLGLCADGALAYLYQKAFDDHLPRTMAAIWLAAAGMSLIHSSTMLANTVQFSVPEPSLYLLFLGAAFFAVRYGKGAAEKFALLAFGCCLAATAVQFWRLLPDAAHGFERLSTGFLPKPAAVTINSWWLLLPLWRGEKQQPIFPLAMAVTILSDILLLAATGKAFANLPYPWVQLCGAIGEGQLARSADWMLFAWATAALLQALGLLLLAKEALGSSRAKDGAFALLLIPAGFPGLFSWGNAGTSIWWGAVCAILPLWELGRRKKNAANSHSNRTLAGALGSGGGAAGTESA